MADAAPFIAAAKQLGYPVAAAQVALEWAAGQLVAHRLERARYYIFRTGGGAGAGGAPEASERPRLLLAFPSADAALGFAQRQQFALAPRLLTLSLAQILSVLLQRPLIGAALFADEGEPTIGRLPGGMRLERAELIGRLRGATGEIPSADQGEKLV